MANENHLSATKIFLGMCHVTLGDMLRHWLQMGYTAVAKVYYLNYRHYLRWIYWAQHQFGRRPLKNSIVGLYCRSSFWYYTDHNVNFEVLRLHILHDIKVKILHSSSFSLQIFQDKLLVAEVCQWSSRHNGAVIKYEHKDQCIRVSVK